MSGLINPKCQVPLYLTDKITAVSCARLDSILLIVIIAIVAICCIVFLFYSTTYDKRYTEDQKYTITMGIISCAICISLIAFIASPFIAAKSWDGYQEMYSAYSNKGIDPANAVMGMQSLQQTNISADAVRSGAYAIALSNLLR